MATTRAVPGVDEVSLCGLGDLVVEQTGRAGEDELAITGSGRIRCVALRTDSCLLCITGSGSLNAAEALDARITGSGSIRYSGSPKVTSRITGSGRITHISA